MTHDQEEALSIADRIAVMANGRIEQVGRPEEIYGAPRTEFVADFIGIANLLECRVVSASAGLVEWAGLTLRVPSRGLRDGEAVVISVRPEKLTLADSASVPAGDNRLEGVVEVATFLGATVRAEVTVAGRTFFVDVPHAQAQAVTRRQRLTLAFASADCVVVSGVSLTPLTG